MSVKSSHDRVSIAALGGVNEIGKNMHFIQCNDDIIVVDCGSKFPDESLLGIDLTLRMFPTCSITKTKSGGWSLPMGMRTILEEFLMSLSS